jgi:TnpA family transposase
MIGGTLNIKHVRAHWDEILRLATSIKQGGTASLMLQAGSYRARTAWPCCASWGASSARCSSMDWLQSSMRRRVHAGLNKASPPGWQAACSSTVGEIVTAVSSMQACQSKIRVQHNAEFCWL